MKYAFWRSSIMLMLLATALMAFVLFTMKHKVRELSKELRSVNQVIISSKEEIHVLETEWAYLTQPQVVQKLSDEYLRLQPIKPAQMMGFNLFMESADLADDE